MKRSLYSILFVILLAFTTVFFVSCNGGQTGDGDKSVPENVVLPDIEMAGGYTASITDGSARTAVCYTQGEGSPLTVIVTRTDKTGSEVAVSKEYYYRGVSDGGEYYLVIRSNGDKHVYANGYEYLYGATAYDRESFTFFSSDMILTEMNLAANPYVYDIFGGAGKAYNLAKFKKYPGGVSQYRASGADLNSLLVPDTAVVDMWISSKDVVTRFRITDGKNVIVNVRYTKVGETDSPALPSDVELSKVCAHNFVWTPDENGTHKGVCTYDESHIVTGLSCYGGVATCVSGRKCDLCGGEYGDVDPDSHDFEWKSNGDDTHTEVCKRNEEHKGRTESCWDFTEATCVGKATCKVCGGERGEIALENHDYKWVANGDGTHTQICTRDEKHIGLTENCSGGKATCTEQATCEVCGEKYGEPLGHKLPDKWTKGEGDKHIKRCLNEGCSYYEEEACSGGEAICIGKAICDVCGGEYGEIDENNHYYEWVSNGDGTHTEVCKRNREHKGKTEECRGGKATCTEKAVCEVCGEKYGEPLGHDFSVWVDVDKDYHKKVCSHDEKHVYQTQKHNFGKWTSDGNGKHYRVCETCNRREEAACNFSEPTCTEKAKWAIGSKGAEATLPENVNIAKGLFGNNAEITTVTVGKGVKLYDGILTEFGGNTLKIDFGNAFFNGKTAAALFNGSVYSSSMPYAEVVGDGDETYYVPMSLENAVVLSENVPAGAFRNMSMLKTVDLQNVKEIGERAFMGCSGITSVTLSENLEKINAYAFYGSSAITEITIPKSVKKVGTYAFGECGELTVTVEYDKGTDKRYNAIEASAFYKSVVTVKFGGTEAEWKGFVKADWNYSGEAKVEYAA